MEGKDCVGYEDVVYVARYTVHKIRAYPKRCGRDMSYFKPLFWDELRNYLTRREVNRRSQEIAIGG